MKFLERRDLIDQVTTPKFKRDLEALFVLVIILDALAVVLIAFGNGEADSGGLAREGVGIGLFVGCIALLFSMTLLSLVCFGGMVRMLALEIVELKQSCMGGGNDGREAPVSEMSD